ncbi:MAG: acetyltransferase [Erythrobacter sp.]|nr:acetyltransferase [Erythrobacter sp.]NCQ63590.1 acetyltransferase [Alphaproteobacteria bacterium]
MAKQTIYIFGTSGFAREVADIARENGHEIAFLTQSPDQAEDLSEFGEVIPEGEVENLSDGLFAIGIGDNAVRRKIVQHYGDRLRFPALVHPSASFGIGQRERIEAMPGVIVCAGVRFTNRIEVGAFSIFNLNATIGHDVIVDEFCNIAPGANLSGYVHLRSGVWIGTGAAVNQGQPGAYLEIGANTMIGSGSVVVKSCEADSVYVGIPAKARG